MWSEYVYGVALGILSLLQIATISAIVYLLMQVRKLKAGPKAEENCSDIEKSILHNPTYDMEKPSSKTIESPVKQQAAKYQSAPAKEPRPPSQQQEAAQAYDVPEMEEEEAQAYEVPEMETAQAYEVPNELVEYDQVDRTPPPDEEEDSENCGEELYENFKFHAISM